MMDGAPPFLPPGVHRIDADAYHADRLRPEVTLSSTLARTLLDRSPLHAFTAHPRLNPAFEPTDRKTFDIGRAAHRAVLGQGGDYVAYPADLLASNGAASTKAAKDWAEEQRAAGRTPLKADEVDKIGAMADATRRALAAMGITLDPARSELTALAEVEGVWCRAMVDNAPEQPIRFRDGARKVLVDFKTTEDATPDAMVRSVESYGYDVQAAFYLETWAAATGENRDFLFVFTEKSPPHETSVVRLLNEAGHSGDWMEDAKAKTAAARMTWGECLRTGVWPGYPRHILEVGARGFYRQRWQDQAGRAASAAALETAYRFQSPN